MRGHALTFTLVMVTSIVACALPAVEDTPFYIAPDSLRSDIRTIAVTPVTSPDAIIITGSAAAKLEAAIEEQLLQAGFSVVPSYEYIGMWQHITDEIGGFYDTYTGERDEDLFNLATNRLRTELSERFQVDALFYPELWEGKVPFYDGVAEWDGASQTVFGAYGLSGQVYALSLVVSIEDMSGTELYGNDIGLATTEAWYRNSWLPLVMDGVLGDPRVVSTAVTGVLAPILELLHPDSTQVR
jgi:hypothetical protein